MTAPYLEGSLRELALADVLQLLELGRKSGLLRVRATDGGPSGRITLVDGAVCDAVVDGTASAAGAHRARGHERAVVDAVCVLVAARAGSFTFAPAPEAASGRGVVRLRIEAVLVEAARRADEWGRLAELVPHAGVVPTLAAGAPGGELLDLNAAQWALLAEVDGRRDVATVAAALGRDALAVAEELAALARAGVVRAAEVAPAIEADVPAADVARAPA